MSNNNLSFDKWDELNAPERAAETGFDRVVSRRFFLKGLSALGAAAFITSSGLGARSALANAITAGNARFIDTEFTPMLANSSDSFDVPAGFKAEILVRWGDPLFSATPDFDHESRGTALSQMNAVGDNNDGMDTFVVDGDKTLLVFNNEYTNLNVMFGNRASSEPESEDDINKGKAAHGLTVVEIENTSGQWKPVLNSPYNRRITPDTTFEVAGPVAGSPLIQTSADPKGIEILGTFNNCGNGKTPWGTYLACEENFNSYFLSSEGEAFQQTAAQKRYGIASKGKDRGYGWGKVDSRFDVSKEPNEPNRHGWVVEVDPTGKRAPKKLTALGRFKHENAELTLAKDGRAVVYLGDDERGEFLYKFVSRERYQADSDNWNLLDEGDLFVAKFNEDGSGEWLPLAAAGMAADETLVFAREAASKVGATTMDRPEWVAANPLKPEAYVSLTNNSKRGDSFVTNAANPRAKNIYGQIVKWVPLNEDHASADFTWDFFVIAGNPDVHNDEYAGSGNINPDNMFNSPDGLKFDSQGNLWIQTDGNYSNEKGFVGMGNNQMLLANTETGEINRFLVGPKECEITGLTWSPDKKTMFVGVQHPGEQGDSHWPDGPGKTPRSAIVAISREDGGLMG